MFNLSFEKWDIMLQFGVVSDVNEYFEFLRGISNEWLVEFETQLLDTLDMLYHNKVRHR